MPNSAQTRREPQKGKNGFSAQKGFTLIEVLIAIAVVAIVASLALPSYRSIIEKRQVTSGAEQLAAFLSAVQMESVKRSENITVSYQSGANWCIGVATGVDACDCTDTDPATADCVIDSQVRVVNNSNLTYPDVVSAIDGDGAFIFDPARGLIYDDSGFAAFDEAELEMVSADGTYAMNVQITSTGRVKMCSDSDDKAVPGYKTCARDIQ
jgi:prepilin-type N-terminal cleavage/methylation domain-containing protein